MTFERLVIVAAAIFALAIFAIIRSGDVDGDD